MKGGDTMEKKERRKSMFITKTYSVLDKKTGEVIQQRLTERRVTTGSEDINFFKIWLEHLTEFLNTYGNTKSKVLSYLLQRLIGHISNTINITQREISEETKISLPIVNRTLAILRKMNIIRYNSGEIMINPDFIAYGTNKTRNEIKERYNKF